MKIILTFESFNEDTKRPERKPREKKEDIKRCIGKCNRQLVIKDGKPVIFCPSCDRVLGGGF